MFAIKVNTLNSSKSFIMFENENLSYTEAKEKLNQYNEKIKQLLAKGIKPTIKDDRGNNCKITNLEIVNKGYSISN
jgi:hypothetical protein